METTTQQPGSAWLTAAEVQAVTGWDSRFIALARMHGLFKMKRRRKTGAQYLLKSVEDLKARL